MPVEIIDPVLEQQGKRSGHDVSYQLIYRRGGFAVLVRQVVKYELPTKDGSTTVLGAEVPKSIFVVACCTSRARPTSSLRSLL